VTVTIARKCFDEQVDLIKHDKKALVYHVTPEYKRGSILAWKRPEAKMAFKKFRKANREDNVLSTAVNLLDYTDKIHYGICLSSGPNPLKREVSETVLNGLFYEWWNPNTIKEGEAHQGLESLRERSVIFLRNERRRDLMLQWLNKPTDLELLLD
jgi:hypothetical protein